MAHHDGVRALWVKVIVRAVFDYVTYKRSNLLQRRRWAITAHNWLWGPSIGFFNNFENICFHLGIDPNKVRMRAKTITKNDVKKIEHLDRIEDPKKRYKRELAILKQLAYDTSGEA